MFALENRLLTCSSCGTSPVHNTGDIKKENILVHCPNCGVQIPILNDIIYYTERNITSSSRTDLQFDHAVYLDFIDQKRIRKTVDLYSAFQPFNESSRAFYPLIQMVRNALKPGDIILDTWCRNGWTAYFLSGLFPKQKILSIWEGNHDVLGYRGFDFWMDKKRKPDNVELMFCDLNEEIPLKSNTVQFVFGLDTLHRYKQQTLVHEIIRVTKKDGLIIFPHVHLSNSEPDPYFDRGERQLHGRVYSRYFNQLLNTETLDAFILSEPELFQLKAPRKITSNPDMRDYNGLIAILPKSNQDSWLVPYNVWSENPDDIRFVLNPLLKYDLTNNKIGIDHDEPDGTVDQMLDRHPIYERLINATNNYDLNDVQLKVIYWAMRRFNVSEISQKLCLNFEHLKDQAIPLIEHEILHALPISENACSLHRYHSQQLFRIQGKFETLQTLWNDTIALHHNRTGVIDSDDGSSVTYQELDQMVQEISEQLMCIDTAEKPLILISAKPHLEGILVYWSCMRLGIEVMIINTQSNQQALIGIVDEYNPDIIFTDSQTYNKFQNTFRDKIILFDEDCEIKDHLYLSAWLAENPMQKRPVGSLPKIQPEEQSTILFTSGTSGPPKGVPLSHGALYRSGRSFSELYHWTSKDRILVSSELDSMSGLRNPCIAALFAGMTIVIPKLDETHKVFSIVDEIHKNSVSILTTTPGLIRQLIQLGEKIKDQMASLRQILCTGGHLSIKLIEEFEEVFGIRILNYYGLTETTGLCIGESPDEYATGSIGKPIESIVQIVDEHDEIVPIGQTGELRIYSDNLMRSYCPDRQGLDIRKGWLYTSDLACRNADGYIFLKGRKREIIKDPDGRVVSITELVEYLEKLKNVKQAAACPIIERDMEEILVWIIPSENGDLTGDTKNQILDIVRDGYGSGIPIRSILIKEWLPTTLRGDVDKKQLLNDYLDNDYRNN